MSQGSEPQVAAPAAQTHEARSSGAWLLATFFGAGHLRPGPGTWASASVVALWWLATQALPYGALTALTLVLAALLVILGIPAATTVARESRRLDPPFVVVDEAAGQLIALIALPLSWKTVLVSFILFRGFDILKPPPVRRLERLPGGVGIMMDDVMAGAYALAFAHALAFWGWLA